MLTRYVTVPAPGAAGEDYVVTGPGWWAVLDGATAPRGVDSGCVHDVRWLVRQLGSALSAGLIRDADAPIADIVADAITAARQAHQVTCDLSNPDSPSSTVTVARLRQDMLECFILGDSPVVVQHRDRSLSVVSDTRTDHLPGGRPYSVELVRASRNRQGGFWVASTLPAAAYEAVVREFKVEDLDMIGMFTDGATRLVDRYGMCWDRLFPSAVANGPAWLIERTRQAESTQPPPYGKQFDDATVVLVTNLAGRE